MKPFEKHPIVKKALSNCGENIKPNLVGVRGKLYDLSDFDHPGGNAFINICKGLDATSLFETHHINIKRAEIVLSTIEPKGNYEYHKFSWNSYNTLRNTVFSIFPTRKSRRMNVKTLNYLYVYVFLTIIFHVYILSLEKINYYYFAICTLSSILNTICGGFGHNGLHRLELSSILLDWNGLSSYEWLHEHVHSHHMYVNTVNDHDAISMTPFLNWIEGFGKAIFGSKGKHIIYSLGVVIVAIQGNFVHRTRWDILNSKDFPIFMKLAPIVFILRVASHIIFQGLYQGLLTCFFIMMLGGYYFSTLAHLNHANPDTEMLNDFISSQLSNTIDINVPHYLSHFFLFLDSQRCHHLFPTIDHSQLFYLQGFISGRSKNMFFLNDRVNKTLNKVCD